MFSSVIFCFIDFESFLYRYVLPKIYEVILIAISTGGGLSKKAMSIHFESVLQAKSLAYFKLLESSLSGL